MKTIELSGIQLHTLKRLAAKDAKAHYMRYMGRFNPNAYWFISDDAPDLHLATKQIEKLLALGFLELQKDSLGYPDTATITKAGREFLKGQP